MQFQPALQRATLERRYKRFLADVITEDGQRLTIHCPNTGAMTGCAEPGYEVWYSTSDNAKRKYPNTWELSRTPDHDFIVINTQRANQIAEQAIQQNCLPKLTGYQSLRREVRYGEERSRVDLFLEQHQGGKAECFIEVKSVTLNEHGCGYFPDAVTTRGQKHLRELQAMVAAGYRAALLFVVGHSGINKVKPAAHIDPLYAQLCIQAQQHGVELYALSCQISAQGIEPGEPMTVELPQIGPI
ncbi:DNA/RNA nuclease SfsA [Aliidiomarina sedimenti]|uniref:Sugar fermentation stimulation protein homolog n=1 Tax=Aliidiomarina sedimenti TaxID=1933879 RepID=A0ABY0BV89_9GAMM|nr:DNA/RNA nuclease SfsA [Aliidiomarina sedimenti]RUO27926.1 DNA/RNA nuclease SfsA [Aliidiomarina sedimenti]